MSPDPSGADAAAAGRAVPALAARGVSRRFGRVQALRDVTVELHPGEVHAIVGENGAGKSTLTNLLGGVLEPDEGTVEVHGESCRFGSPAEALQAGIGIVFQEQSLVPDMSVADNVLLGVQPRRGPFIQRRRQRDEVRRQLERVGAGMLPADLRVRELSVARGQLVEIAKVLARNPSVVIFDEPTAVLPADDTQHLLALIRRLAQEGVAIGYISHRLNEVEEIADQVTVLRDGELVWTKPMASVTLDEIVSAMVGR